MADKRGLDSHQIIGVMMIGGVFLGLVGLAFQRFDVVIMAGFGAYLVYLFTKPRGVGSRDGDGGGGLYDSEDSGGCGGDGGGD